MMRINEQQFERAVTQYQALVFSICLTMTKNYFDAEDLAQDTFVSAYRGWNGFDGKNPKGWLTAIAVNKCRDHLKSPARKNLPLAAEDAALLLDPDGTPEEQAEDRMSLSHVRRLCRRLREPYRSVAESYFCGEKKLSELARETGQNIRTLETRLYRAKKLLKALWEEEEG
ncbi:MULTISPECIES: RNA polymerase sigma factor [Acutalibacteraceae]|uniref:RNA polymerase sigma factor n=1 Tax=Acutalibacteraceae TaxID=3082771 RepID=UPI00196B3CD5|nr:MULTISPECIES: sigma-70 family RNA polymerase sigma factor [Acutalibacteraceae]